MCSLAEPFTVNVLMTVNVKLTHRTLASLKCRGRSAGRGTLSGAMAELIPAPEEDLYDRVAAILDEARGRVTARRPPTRRPCPQTRRRLPARMLSVASQPLLLIGTTG
jgi:hypothetical protein